MRILHLANHCDEVGNGIMNVAVDVACKQAELGHRVAFASAGGSYIPLLERYGATHTLIEQPWRRPYRLVPALARLRRLISDLQPDIVHAHMMTGAILARLLRQRTGFRLVTTVHNEWQRGTILMGLGDRVIAVSDIVREQMQCRGIPATKLRVVRNATFGTPRWTPSSEPTRAMSLDHPAILTVAGMNERKGIRDLIAAFDRIAEKHASAALYLVGDGPDRTAFEKLARTQRFSSRIHFPGFVRDPRPYFAGADVFVLASHSEPFGLVLGEAREEGCAIVATNVGGIPEALDGGEAGILVPARDPERLAKAIDGLLTDRQELDRWRKRARENTEWLHLDRAIAETMAVYEELLSGRAASAADPRGKVSAKRVSSQTPK